VRNRVVILGAGPAGTGAAYQLALRGDTPVVVLEQQARVGGNAGSFELEGTWVDYGSHRLHPACDPDILRDLRRLLAGDLLDRPRHGRILLQGRWIHFPLKPIDLLLRLPKRFALGVAADMISKRLGRGSDAEETFASILQRGLGRTICENFYFPYARKLWGLAPEELAATQARRRVSGNSFAKLLRKLATAVPGLKPAGAGRFFYPRCGYGQISERLHETACRHGAEFIFEARVTEVACERNGVAAVHYEHRGEQHTIRTNTVWSTLPVTLLARMLRPAAPAAVLDATSRICYRGMVLIYLVLQQDRFTEYDAHYFPDTTIPISRLSEPKNYSGTTEPRGRTVLCAELPVDPSSLEWQMTDEQLGEALCRWLALAGLPVRVPVRRVVTRRLRQAYPVYRQDYEQHFATIDRWLGTIEGLLTFGRQGLFAHDNTHHALYMAYSAVKCLQQDGSFDRQSWARFREIFETHVVED
jgi:protoporphyrinogen oxidase